MPEQNCTEDGCETEKNAQAAEPAEYGGEAQTGETPLEEGDSGLENAAFNAGSIIEEALAGESPAEWPDSGGGDGIEQDFTGETAGEGENLQEEAGVNENSAEQEAGPADLAAQLADTRDQLLRKAADFENFRKRMNQEKQGAIEFANQSLLLDIIPIIDDFERAIQSAEASEELAGLPAGKALLEGIIMIEKQLTGRLESKWGLKRFDSAGEPFDPNFHEAMMMEKSPDTQEPVVLEDFIKGYTLKDRVIRAAKVKVLMPEDGE